MKHRTKLLAAMLGTAMLLNGSFAAAGKPGNWKVSQKTEVWLSSKTRISGFSLPPGHYLFQHTMEGSDHMMTFVQLKAGNSPLSVSTHKLMPVRVRCRLEPLERKAPQSAFYSLAEGDANRALRLEIKGEDVAHIFPVPETSTPMQ